MNRVAPRDRQILRELAREVREIAGLPEQEEKAGRWLRINRLERVKPPVLMMVTGDRIWSEMPPETQEVTEGGFARSYERDLRRRIFLHRHIHDDRIVTATVPVPLVMHSSGWGVEADTTSPGVGDGARHYNTVLEGKADLERIRLPKLTIDREATDRDFTAAQELFDGILDVERSVHWGNNYGLAPMDTLGMWRGFDRLFLDLVENPEFVHTAMRRLVDGEIGMIEQLEQAGDLRLNNGRQDLVGTSAVGYTDELPAPGFDPDHVRCRDLWGTCAAQIFSDVSPEMHEEFCLQHEKRFLQRFGRVCYGCCEPLHRKVGVLARNLPNLRRIAVTPWADIDQAAEAIQDRYVYAWRPNPAIAAGATWNPEAARRQIRAFLRRTRGCVVEIIMKDMLTCAGQPQRLMEWAAIAKEEVESFG